MMTMMTPTKKYISFLDYLTAIDDVEWMNEWMSERVNEWRADRMEEPKKRTKTKLKPNK